MRARRRAAALEAAGRALRHRALSEHELDGRLRRARVRAAARDEARATLRAAGYVDDARIAAARAATLSARESGDALIRDDLERRGIPPALVAEALAALPPEAERAREVVARRGPGALRKLAARGFSPDVIEDLAGAVIASGGGDL